MKKPVLLFALGLSVLFLSCGDDEDSCTLSICLNGGNVIDCTCECPVNYEGVFCENDVPPTSMLLKSITITEWPQTDGSGNEWDENSGPDIYLNFESDRVTEIIQNQSLGANITFTFDPPLERSFFDVFLLVDEDSENGTADQVIGGFSVTPWLSGNDHATNNEFSGSNGDIKGFTVAEFEWQ